MTPMTEIEKLKDGVYEKVMSRRFAEVLKEALAEDQVRAEEEDVDAEEAVGYLSSYLQQVIRLCLKDIADRDEENSVDHQLALTNELIASLAKKTEELGGGQEVANVPFLLRSLEHKKIHSCLAGGSGRRHHSRDHSFSPILRRMSRWYTSSQRRSHPLIA